MPFNGRMRKLVMTATRNGYFFVLDRTNGQHLLTSRMGLVNNWAVGLDAKGQPKRNPNKDATIAGSLVNGDVLNYPPPTFSPDTGQFYVHEQNSMRISYLMEPDPRGSMGLGGTTGGGNLSWGTFIVALDYKTGKVTWRKELNGGSVGLLSTAGGLLFLSNGPNVEAWDAATGKGPLVFADRRVVESGRDVHARRQAAPALHRRQRAALPVRVELVDFWSLAECYEFPSPSSKSNALKLDRQ